MNNYYISRDSWSEWVGNDFPAQLSDSVVYRMVGWVTVEDESVPRLYLAKTLKLDGVAVDMSEAYRLVDDAVLTQGLAVRVEGELEDSYYDPANVDYDGVGISHPRQMTWVEVSDGR